MSEQNDDGEFSGWMCIIGATLIVAAVNELYGATSAMLVAGIAFVAIAFYGRLLGR